MVIGHDGLLSGLAVYEAICNGAIPEGNPVIRHIAVACIIHISYPSSPRSGYYHAVSEPRPLDSFLLSQSPGSLTA